MIIAVDFDGVLHHGTYPQIGVPSQEARAALATLKQKGHYIIIWTCRNGDLLLQAINWLVEEGFQFSRVNDQEPQNAAKYGDNSRKVYADVYIDDHNACGLPSWDDIIKYVTTLENE